MDTKVTWLPRAFNLRMSEPLRAQLKQEAEKNHRSLNAEIIHRLQKSLTGWR